MTLREIIPCQICHRDIEDLADGLVVWSTTKDKPGVPSIKVVHRGKCDPWRGQSPHSLPLLDFQSRPLEVRRMWAGLVKDGSITGPVAWEGVGRIYESITEKDYFRLEETSPS